VVLERGFRVLGLTVSTRTRNRSSKETRTHADRGRWSSDPPLSLWKSLHQERERERGSRRVQSGVLCKLDTREALLGFRSKVICFRVWRVLEAQMQTMLRAMASTSLRQVL
jgi:hypothetical protein